MPGFAGRSPLVPVFLNQRLPISIPAAYKSVFLADTALSLLLGALYSLLSPAVEVGSGLPLQDIGKNVAPASKRVIAKFTALFSLEAFGGGFLIDALASYWFFRRFHIPEQDIDLLFFAVHALDACSHQARPWSSRKGEPWPGMSRIWRGTGFGRRYRLRQDH